MAQGKIYKEILQKEISELPENDIIFLTQLITLIRKHKEKYNKN